jgi:hypothetical protein
MVHRQIQGGFVQDVPVDKPMDILNHGRGFSHTPLSGNQGKPVLKAVLCQKIPFERSVEGVQKGTVVMDQIFNHHASIISGFEYYDI